MPEDEEIKLKCQKCDVDYCDECSGTKNSIKCKSCINYLSPIYEGNEIVKCICEEGEKEKCRKCNKNKSESIACNEGYKLINGKCIYYSFKAIYNITYKSNFVLINDGYLKNIIYMIIDGKQVEPCSKYTFQKIGIHKVSFFFDIKELAKLSKMFYIKSLFFPSINLVEISFTSKFNTQNIIDMSEMFSHCHHLVSADISVFNTEKVTKMNDMFRNCYSLKSINLSNFNTEK
jgi:surface protein